MEQNGFELQIKFQPLPHGQILIIFLFNPTEKEHVVTGSLLLLVENEAVLELLIPLPPPPLQHGITGDHTKKHRNSLGSEQLRRGSGVNWDS